MNHNVVNLPSKMVVEAYEKIHISDSDVFIIFFLFQGWILVNSNSTYNLDHTDNIKFSAIHYISTLWPNIPFEYICARPAARHLKSQ